jgi:hypothetical protein
VAQSMFSGHPSQVHVPRRVGTWPSFPRSPHLVTGFLKPAEAQLWHGPWDTDQGCLPLCTCLKSNSNCMPHQPFPLRQSTPWFDKVAAGGTLEAFQVTIKTWLGNLLEELKFTCSQTALTAEETYLTVDPHIRQK